MLDEDDLWRQEGEGDPQGLLARFRSDELPLPFRFAKEYLSGSTLAEIGRPFGLEENQVSETIRKGTPWTLTVLKKFRSCPPDATSDGQRPAPLHARARGALKALSDGDPDQMGESLAIARELLMGSSPAEVADSHHMTGYEVQDLIFTETPWTAPQLEEAGRAFRNAASGEEHWKERAATPAAWCKADLAEPIEVARELFDVSDYEFQQAVGPVRAQMHQLAIPGLDELIDWFRAHEDDNLLRPLDMARRYALGQTLGEIGEAYGITRERVRQIIGHDSPWKPDELRRARNRWEAAKEEADRGAVLAWSDDNPGIPLEVASKDLVIDEEEIRRYLGRRVKRHQTRMQQPQPLRSDEDILEDVRRFFVETSSTTAAAYAEWARQEGVPGPQTAAHRFGSWNRATALAGIKSEAPIERARKHTDTDLWAAVYEATQAELDTARAFEDWLSETPGAPSFALIRSRLECTWGEMHGEALRLIAGQSDRDPEWIADVTKPRDWTKFLEEDDPLEHMRAARLALGRNMTMVRYAEWAKASGRPGVATILRRTGERWGDLVKSVGGRTVRKELRIPDEELLAWLRVFLESNPTGSFTAYEKWRERLGAPGTGTILRRFTSWDRALSLAKAGA